GHGGRRGRVMGELGWRGGHPPRDLLTDAITPLLPGALGTEASSVNESFSQTEFDANQGVDSARHSPLTTRHCLLDFPHYTRPADFRGWTVPEVLIGGNHAEVAKCRRQQAIAKTRRHRPDPLPLE